MTQEQENELKVIISSIYYLENESRKLGLQKVADILKQTIAEIDALLQGSSLTNNLFYEEILNSDLYQILTIVNKFANIDRRERLAISKAIALYEENVELAV